MAVAEGVRMKARETRRQEIRPHGG
jgi:hypothetical protein